MPDTTPCVDLPYPIGSDPLQIQADVQRLAEALDAILCTGVWHTGDIKNTIAPTAPPGWLMLDGSTITDGQTVYPDLWAVAPATWKSGANLVLPNMSNRVQMGGGTIGSVGGANSKVLSVANLPVHDHSMAHTHPITHDHKNANTGTGGYHDHGHVWSSTEGNSNGTMRRGDIDASGNYDEGLANGVIYGGAHAHTFDVPTYNGNSGASSAARTGDTGSASPIDTTPLNMRVNVMVKT